MDLLKKEILRMLSLLKDSIRFNINQDYYYILSYFIRSQRALHRSYTC